MRPSGEVGLCLSWSRPQVGLGGAPSPHPPTTRGHRASLANKDLWGRGLRSSGGAAVLAGVGLGGRLSQTPTNLWKGSAFRQEYTHPSCC